MALWRRRSRPAETAPGDAWGWAVFAALYLGLPPVLAVAAGFFAHILARLFGLGWGLWRW